MPEITDSFLWGKTLPAWLKTCALLWRTLFLAQPGCPEKPKTNTPHPHSPPPPCPTPPPCPLPPPLPPTPPPSPALSQNSSLWSQVPILGPVPCVEVGRGRAFPPGAPCLLRRVHAGKRTELLELHTLFAPSSACSKPLAVPQEGESSSSSSCPAGGVGE